MTASLGLKPLILCIGLGNPGSEYVSTRHNLGFMAVEEIARIYGFSPFKRYQKALVSEGTIEGVKVVLLKPMTFMNRSGIPVQEYIGFFKIPLDHIIVIHDDIALSVGKIKIKQGGSAGGHNGLRSLDAHIGNNYWRLRLGVDHPGHREAVAGYLLKNFTKKEGEELEIVLQAVAKEASLLMRQEMPLFLNQVALSLKTALAP